MQFSEWALVAFTILVQSTVGFYFAFGIFDIVTRKKYCAEAASFIDKRAFVFVTAIIFIAAFFSLLHLGRSFNAFYVFSNIGESWLSREILLLVIFIIAGFFVAMVYYKNLLSSLLRSGIVWLTAFVGLALVYAMSRIYMLPTVPTWNSDLTPISFFLTTLILGAGVLFIFVYCEFIQSEKDKRKIAVHDDTLIKKFLKYIIFSGFIILSAEIIFNILQAADFVNRFNMMNSGGFVPNCGLIWLLRIRIIFAFFGLAFMIYSFNKSLKTKLINYKWIVMFAFAFIAVSEILGRFFFYSIYFRIGL